MQALAKVDDVKMDLTLTQVGSLFAKSGMFKDVRDEAQALTKILAGRELGFSPFTSMSDLYIVQGKMTIGAHLFAARLKEHPRYDFEVKKHDNESCVIDFYEVSKRTGKWQLAGTSEFSLYARAMSNGCKWYAPDLFQASTYAPGEIPEPMQAVEPDETPEEREIVDSYLEPEPPLTEADMTEEEMKLVTEMQSTIYELLEMTGWANRHKANSVKKHLFDGNPGTVKDCDDPVKLSAYVDHLQEAIDGQDDPEEEPR